MGPAKSLVRPYLVSCVRTGPIHNCLLPRKWQKAAIKLVPSWKYFPGNSRSQPDCVPPALIHLYAELILAWWLMRFWQSKNLHAGKADLGQNLGQEQAA